MSIEQLIRQQQSEIITDSYEMSIGEIVNLYRDGEIEIAPDYQRLFRWDSSRKTKFIESLFLRIPTPSIFVYQNERGIWELVDGLQRISTILQFMGILNPTKEYKPLILEGTKRIPKLKDLTWAKFPTNLQLEFKRTRIRVEILKSGSDVSAKFELFQRLNTGGIELSEQEVRNCSMIQLDQDFYSWIAELATSSAFTTTINISESEIIKQKHIELALRFIAYRNIRYDGKIDVNDYLDNAAIELIKSQRFNRKDEKNVFLKTFRLLEKAASGSCFKRYDKQGDKFLGQFLITKFETISVGVSKAINKNIQPPTVLKILKTIDDDPTYKKYSGTGIRAASRLPKLLKLGTDIFNDA